MSDDAAPISVQSRPDETNDPLQHVMAASADSADEAAIPLTTEPVDITDDTAGKQLDLLPEDDEAEKDENDPWLDQADDQLASAMVSHNDTTMESGVAQEQPVSDASDEMDHAPHATDANEPTTEAEFAAFDTVQNTDAAEEFEDAATHTDTPTEDAAPKDTIAAKLQRIRAVVSGYGTAHHQKDETPDLTEDEPKDAFVAQVAQEMTRALDADTASADAEPQNSGDTAASALPGDAQLNERQGPTLPGDYPAYTQDCDPYEHIPEPGFAAAPEISPTAQGDDPDDEHDDSIVATLPEEIEITRSVMQSALQAGDATPSHDARLQTPPTEDAATVSPQQSNAGEDTAFPDAADAPPRSRPRIVKVQRRELDAALAAGELEELGPDAPDPDLNQSEAQCEAENTSSAAIPAQEAVQTWGTGSVQEAPVAIDPNDSVKPPRSDTDDEVARLMKATGDRMKDDETTTAREDFNTARAAIAATRTSEPQCHRDVPDVDDTAFREDLNRIIRPRRPIVSETLPERPSVEPNLAPLQLVAEQRVDCAIPHGPVRPRRVASVSPDESGASDKYDENFADFAAQMGASGLPELLEAAAAYLSFVEGRAQFSRPQLMNKVRQIDSSGFNREDGLRSFGLLLREGKIEKTGGGRFAAAEEIGFRPDQRVAG
ncbi:hypothetical protein I5535_13835 [Rhodobacteraceae bacterium F11138]|nr:hypothetical protein [Rhodobacteraceae bacterium F11138]